VPGPQESFRVWALAGDPAAQLALLRRLVDFDLIGTDRVGGGVAPPPPTPPDMRARIRRFVKPSD
jgi:hypothetical protein